MHGHTAPSAPLLRAVREAAELPGPHAVQVLGRCSGTIYLNNGKITGIDSSGTPDIRTRLMRSGFADDGAGRTGAGDPEALRENLRRRIELGEVDGAEIAAVALSAIFDAGWDLFRHAGLAPPRLRLDAGHQSGHGIDHRVAVDDLERVVAERIGQGAGLPIDADRPVDLSPLRAAGAVLDAEEWRVVARANGRLTARDLAWAVGSEVFATLLVTARLVERGLLVATSPVAAHAVTARSGATTVSLRSGAGPVIAAQRRPDTPPQGFTALLAPPEWAADLEAASSDDPDVLQRLICGLRALG